MRRQKPPFAVSDFQVGDVIISCSGRVAVVTFYDHSDWTFSSVDIPIIYAGEDHVRPYSVKHIQRRLTKKQAFFVQKRLDELDDDPRRVEELIPLILKEMEDLKMPKLKPLV